MLDAFSRVVEQADRQGAYLSEAQVNALSAMVADSNKRLDVVNRLNSSAAAITSNAYRALVADQPQVFGPGGACFHHRNQAACLRDLGFILRYVTYSMLAGDASGDGRSLPEWLTGNLPSPRNTGCNRCFRHWENEGCSSFYRQRPKWHYPGRLQFSDGRTSWLL